jgi:hypothetical protein
MAHTAREADLARVLYDDPLDRLGTVLIDHVAGDAFRTRRGPQLTSAVAQRRRVYAQTRERQSASPRSSCRACAVGIATRRARSSPCTLRSCPRSMCSGLRERNGSAAGHRRCASTALSESGAVPGEAATSAQRLSTGADSIDPLQASPARALSPISPGVARQKAHRPSSSVALLMAPVEVASRVASRMASGRVVLARSLLPLPGPTEQTRAPPMLIPGSLVPGWAGVSVAGRAWRGRRSTHARCRSALRRQAPARAWIGQAVERWRVDRRAPRNRFRPLRAAVLRSRRRGRGFTARAPGAIPAARTGRCRRRCAPRQALALARRSGAAGITEPPRRTGGAVSPRTCAALHRLWRPSRAPLPSG